MHNVATVPEVLVIPPAVFTHVDNLKQVALVVLPNTTIVVLKFGFELKKFSLVLALRTRLMILNNTFLLLFLSFWGPTFGKNYTLGETQILGIYKLIQK